MSDAFQEVPAIEDERGYAEILIPSGYVLVPAQTEDEDHAIEVLQMKLSEAHAILDDRRLRVNAMEAALHAAHHYPDRSIEDLFDAIYTKLLGGSA